MRPNVLVSHPARQHVHHLVYALQEEGYLTKFITSVWYKPDKFPYSLIKLLPSHLKKPIEKELRKRYYENIDESFVEQFPFFEILRENIDRFSKGFKSEIGIHVENRIHDWYTASRIAQLRPNIVLGYEMSSLKSFKKAKSLNAVTVLDLTQVHYKFIDGMREQYREYEKTFDREIINRVNRLKEEELNYADYIITLSNLVKQSLINNGIPESRIYLAHLGFDPSKFTQKESYSRNNTFKLLYVGSITERKGIRLILEVLNELALRDIELILIGTATDDGREVLKNYRGLFRYIPYLSHEQLVAYYQDADVFVFPSYLDSWGMVVIESMACGTPVIVSENTGAKEVVIDGENGFIIPVRDIGALKEKISYLYSNRNQLERLGRNARKQVKNYTWDNYRKKIREIISYISEKI